jgi:apolipoprotein N-acyltransferase
VTTAAIWILSLLPVAVLAVLAYLLRHSSVGASIAAATISVVIGLLLGAAAIFGITLMVQQDTKPPLTAGDPQSSLLNRVEYGNRS